MSHFSAQKKSAKNFAESYSDALYHIFLFDGKGALSVDCTDYDFDGKTAVFTSPYQNFSLKTDHDFELSQINFHGDFYCIEYHKKEVACNGLLFNNIYLYPQISLDDETFAELQEIFIKIENTNPNEAFSDAVLKSYLQLILAISSREKNKILQKHNLTTAEFAEVKSFQNLLEENFLKERSPAFYADLMHISPNTLSKKLKAEFGKPPSQLIQERVILEAKKRIHLTRKSIKEIASDLNFEDEFYFSKYFKKHSGVSPTQFREEVGISVVADL